MKYSGYLKGTLKTILLNLLEKNGRMYGYEICKSVAELTKDEISLTFGALYPILHKLEAEELLITSTELYEGRARKYYSLTKKGKKENAIKTKEFMEFAEIMSTLLNAKPLSHG